LARARKGRRGTWLGVRLDWFGVRVALGAVATAVLLLGLRGSHGPGLLARGAPPWPAPAPAGVAAGVHAAGLPLLAAPGEVVRFAVHLDVIVDGKPVTVPSGIGVDARARRTSPVYTSDDSGIVHVASDSDQSVFTLGQFFGEWQVPLSRGRLGGLRASTVSVFLDGSPVAGPPGSVLLTPHLQIAVTYRPGPARVPASYAFPPGT
jgi:hypothetical protein